VSCGTKELFVPSGAVHIRPRKPTEDEVRIAAETTAALALPRPGRGSGSRYGTREPKTCVSRKEPSGSALSPAQARQYFTCDAEVEGVTGLVLVTNVRIEVAPGRGFNYNTDSGHTGIDPKQIVYDIRGSFTHYDCRQSPAGESAFARTHNCSAFDEPAAQGLCFKNTFGDWHCSMHDNVEVSQLVDSDKRGEPPNYVPLVTYSYVVNGQALQCSRVGYSSSAKESLLARNPKGNPVQVFYDPQHPSTAVLEKGGSRTVMMVVGAGVFVGSCLSALASF